MSKTRMYNKKMVKWCNKVANLNNITKEMDGYIGNDEGWTIDAAIGKDKAVLYITLKKYLIKDNRDIEKFNYLVKKKYKIKRSVINKNDRLRK